MADPRSSSSPSPQEAVRAVAKLANQTQRIGDSYNDTRPDVAAEHHVLARALRMSALALEKSLQPQEAVQALIGKWRDRWAEQMVKREHWLTHGRSGSVAATHHARADVYQRCAAELEAALSVQTTRPQEVKAENP